MLARKLRLSKDKDIQKTFKGKSARGSFFAARAISNKYGKKRIAIIVGKKVSSKSTERNLVKRRTSEIIKNLLPKIRGFDVSINALPQSQKAKFSELKSDLCSIFGKLGLFREE